MRKTIRFHMTQISKRRPEEECQKGIREAASSCPIEKRETARVFGKTGDIFRFRAKNLGVWPICLRVMGQFSQEEEKDKGEL